MKKFFQKVTIFIIPIILFFGLPFYSFFSTKEYYSDLDKIIIDNDASLIGFSYNTSNYKCIKNRTLLLKDKFDIIALGSSRVLQIRDSMFNSSFYNAGFTVSQMSQLLPFIKTIPNEKLPKYIILGLDQWWFFSYHVYEPIKTTYTLLPSVKLFFIFWKDLYQKPHVKLFYNFKDALVRVGINAFANGNGYRRDGSYFYNSNIKELLKGDTSLFYHSNGFNYNSILHGDRYNFSRSINSMCLDDLSKTLDYCKNNGVYVIAFIPPFSSLVSNNLINNGMYKSRENLYKKSMAIFEKYDFELYDFSLPESLGIDDSFFIDGIHASEVSMLKMILTMIETGSEIGEFVDKEKLMNSYNYRNNNYLLNFGCDTNE